MAESTGYILAAAGISAANQLLFTPLANGTAPLTSFNWRLVPVTAVAALSLAGLEQLSPQFAKTLALLGLLAVLMVPVGNAPTPVDNLAKVFGLQRK